MLEIGVKNGGSLMLWRAYFPMTAKIYGLDINQVSGTSSLTVCASATSKQ